MEPKIVYTYDAHGRVVAANVSGLVGRVDPKSNTATKERNK